MFANIDSVVQSNDVTRKGLNCQTDPCVHDLYPPEFWFGLQKDVPTALQYKVNNFVVDADFYMQHSGAENTRKSIARAWNYFTMFLNDKASDGIYYTAPTEECLKQYAVWRQCVGAVHAPTINVEISNINHRLHDLGIGMDRQLQCQGLRHLLDGMRRSESLLLGESIPRDTRALVNSLCDLFVARAPSEVEAALILIGKHAVLRCDNLIVNNTTHHLKVSSVVINKKDNSVLLKLPGSKTNQKGKKEYRTLVHRCQTETVDSKYCPACAAIKLIQDRNDKDEALFLNDVGRPFTYKDVHQMMEKIAIALNLNPRYYRPHCLRVGGATDLYQEYGKSIDWIMLNCNWAARRTVLERYLKLVNPDVLEL